MSKPTVLVLGCGDVGSAVAHRLFMLGATVVLQDVASPAHPRRGMAFADAMYVGTATLEGVVACLAQSTEVTKDLWVDTDTIPVTALPVSVLTRDLAFDVLVDAQMKKRKVSEDLRPVAPVTLGLGPGFTPGGNCHSAVETAWSSELGEVLREKSAAPLAGEPRALGGAGRERFLYSETAGTWHTAASIGDHVSAGDVVGALDGQPVLAPLTGTLRGLTHDGVCVGERQKIVEVDPRQPPDVFGLGERPRAIARGVSRALGLGCELPDAFFGFEDEYRRNLDCMPMSMRRKLDLCGLKVSLAQWRDLPMAVRETLLEAPGQNAGEQARVEGYLKYWAGKLGAVLGPAHVYEADLDTAQCIDDVPTALQSRLSELAHPTLPLDRWAGLTELQRYALVKLSRSKSARNLRPALQEFGLNFR